MGGDRNPAEDALRYCEQTASDVSSAKRSLGTACVLVTTLHTKVTVGRAPLDAGDVDRMRDALKSVRTDGEALLKKLTEAEAALDKVSVVGDSSVPRYKDLAAVLTYSSYSESAAHTLVSSLDGLRGWLAANARLAEAPQHGPADPVSALDVGKVRDDVAAVAARLAEAQRLFDAVEQLVAPLAPAPGASVN